MRRLIVFILILASSLLTVLACGPDYPYRDDVRFTVFNPNNFQYHDFRTFNYTSQLFHLDDDTANNNAINTDDNIKLWKQYCNNKVPDSSIAAAVYDLDTSEVKEAASSNLMINYLQNSKDETALNYLFFAKQCENFNAVYDDPWERNETFNLAGRITLKNQAIQNIATIQNQAIQLRYAFLAIRLAYYNGDSTAIESTYRSFFINRKNKNILDWWSMYFWARLKPNAAERNYYMAQVFTNAADKRFVINSVYDPSVPIDSTLQFAKNNKEAAAVWLLAGIENHARALVALQHIHRLQPNSKGFSFLLLREINKLEDWIYTPYYGYFYPSTVNQWDSDSRKDPSAAAVKRIKSDREYAKDLLQFLEKINSNKIENPLLYNTAKAYLHFMTEDYASGIKCINVLQNKVNHTDKLYTQLQIIKALCLTAEQSKGNAVIQDAVKPVLMQQCEKRNYRFVFAIARELEYKNNTTDAALLFSKVNTNLHDDYWYEGYGGNKVSWRSKKNYNTLWLDFYEDYFFYLDAQYNSNQMQALIQSVKRNMKTDTFTNWEYSVARKEISRLYDLLGTKYIRKNELQNALTAFEQINDTLWTSSLYNYHYLDANPFYTNLYNEHHKTLADSIHFTKTTITKTLIEYLRKASNPNNHNRDHDYFLAANCYLNMTYHGNSWMMHRYFWTNGEDKTNLSDDDEFVNCNLAKQYYLKAKAVSKSDAFAALCLRMAGRCEGYKLGYGTFRVNKYYVQIKKQYPDCYDDLISNCQSFNEYFSAR